METTGKTNNNVEVVNGLQITTINNNVEEATRQLQLQSHVDSINESIDVMISLVPPEESEKDSRILRAIHGLFATKCYLEGEL